jgi:hypothetical protein
LISNVMVWSATPLKEKVIEEAVVGVEAEEP